MLRNNNYNPDVLTCLANLSNDEVFTPPQVVNQMLDMLPAELFRSSHTTFLDPVSKSGVFLREIAKRLMTGLEAEIPDIRERANHIFTHQLFGIAITELTSLICRRSVYCSKWANGRYSLCTEFKDAQGNIRFHPMEHTFVGGKCKYCGAAENVFGKQVREDLESHAYEFIHNDNPQKLFQKNMKFDVIIGNPPYQLTTGGENTSQAKPIYHLFVQKAKKLSPRYLCMILPSRWFAGGMGMEDFREEMTTDNKIRYLVDYINAKDCFPQNSISGGVCYFLWEKDYSGPCHFTTINGNRTSSMSRSLTEFSTVVRYNEAVNIIHKTKQAGVASLSTITSPLCPFGIGSAERGTEDARLPIKLFHSKGAGYIHENEISAGHHAIKKYKLMISKTTAEHAGEPNSDGKYKVLSTMKLLGPNEVCSFSYFIMGPFEKEEECKNLLTYLKTKFSRFLLLMSVTSINLSKDKFQFVPIQDFTRPWSDALLYEKYGLTEDEIAFIESMIRPME